MTGFQRIPNIAVIDYDSGNLRSVTKALESAGVTPSVTSDAGKIAQADALILPGVGSGPAAMLALQRRGLVQAIRDYADSGRPLLGICLGLQLFLDRTEEGDALCLGLVHGRVKRLPVEETQGFKIPHMGWNTVHLESNQAGHPLLHGLNQDSYFYFVHSYYAQPDDSSAVAGTTVYGVPFCSIYANGNLFATQFHPEKSGVNGLQIYKNFVGLAGNPSAVSQQSSASG